MHTSNPRHPSRDALLRDSLGQLREQRGVSVERFARTLNSLAHALCPAKTEDMPCLASFTEVSEAYDHAVMSWNKRVQRWASGAVEFPAWLEEPWATALEEFGDIETRIALARRHGFMGVTRPTEGAQFSCGYNALSTIASETADVMRGFAQMHEDGVIDENDADTAQNVLKEIDDAIAALVGARNLIKRDVEVKAPLKAVQ